MHVEDVILAVIAALPNRKIEGKKRLQKMTFFLKSAGLSCDARFDIRDFGPFSRQIAAAADSLAMKGRIEEDEEPIGVSKTYVTVYKITSNEGGFPSLQEKHKRILQELDKYRTVDLEVAATVKYFRDQGLNGEIARKKTVELKPTKATSLVLKNSEKIISALHQ